MNTLTQPKSMISKFSITFKALLIAFVALLGISTPTTVQAADDISYLDDGKSDISELGAFLKLQQKLRGLAVIILIVMLVIAAIMAAFQKTGMALSVAIAAVILFGGIYLLSMIQKGLA